MGSQELLWSLSCLLWSAHCQQTILQLARNSHQLTRQSVWAGDDPGGAEAYLSKALNPGGGALPARVMFGIRPPGPL